MVTGCYVCRLVLLHCHIVNCYIWQLGSDDTFAWDMMMVLSAAVSPPYQAVGWFSSPISFLYCEFFVHVGTLPPWNVIYLGWELTDKSSDMSPDVILAVQKGSESIFRAFSKRKPNNLTVCGTGRTDFHGPLPYTSRLRTTTHNMEQCVKSWKAPVRRSTLMFG